MLSRIALGLIEILCLCFSPIPPPYSPLQRESTTRPGGISDATSVSGRVVEGFSRNCTNNVLYFNIQIAH